MPPLAEMLGRVGVVAPTMPIFWSSPLPKMPSIPATVMKVLLASLPLIVLASTGVRPAISLADKLPALTSGWKLRFVLR